MEMGKFSSTQIAKILKEFVRLRHYASAWC